MADKQDALTGSKFAALAKDAKEAQFTSPMLKDELVGVPFIVTGIELKHSENLKTDYVQLTILLEDDTQHTISDGSTGIMAQVEKMLEANDGDVDAVVPMLVAGGLRKSTYTNQFGENTTYYLAS